jgi:hypothetical protein
MTSTGWFMLALGLAIGAALFFKQGVCTDATTGEVTASPFFIPCSNSAVSDSSSII